MTSPPPEWSGAVSPRPEDSNPAATKLLQALEAYWLASESIAHYPDHFERALAEARHTVTELTPLLQALVDELPNEYVARVRPATPFLFLSWMPIGYASILSVDGPEALPDATLAMMHYGAAVTVLDDIADTDLYDGVWGRGASDTIARFIAAHGVPAPASLLPALPREARWAIDYASERLRRFRALVAELPGAPALHRQFESVIGSFLQSVQTCREVRREIAAGRATPAALRAMANAVPQGMTVVMVALLSYAQRGGRPGRRARRALRDADLAQRICHYQNALATLGREIDDGDPSNPIVLDAMAKGCLDQRAFMGRRLPRSQTLAAVEPFRAVLERNLAAMGRELDCRGLRAERDGLLPRFGFGVRNLQLLYTIARGQV